MNPVRRLKGKLDAAPRRSGTCNVRSDTLVPARGQMLLRRRAANQRLQPGERANDYTACALEVKREHALYKMRCTSGW